MNPLRKPLTLPLFCGVLVSSVATAQPAPPAAPPPEVPAEEDPTVDESEAEQAPAPEQLPAAAEPSTPSATEPAPAAAPTAAAEPAPQREPHEYEAPHVAQHVQPILPDEPETFPRFDPDARLQTGFERESERRYTSRGVTEQERYGFFLKQARVQLQGELTKRIDIEISAELSDGMAPAFDEVQYIRDAFMNLRPEKEFQLRAGVFKRPLSALEHRNAGDLQVRGRGLTNDVIVEDQEWGSRALGMQLWGKFNPLDTEWAVGAFNPAWASDSDLAPKGADLLARLTIEPVKDFTLGVNGGTKTLKAPGAEKYDSYYIAGGDVELEIASWSLLVDFLYAQLPSTVSSLEEQSAMGLVGLTTYDVPLSTHVVLQPVLLGEYFDSSVDHSNSETLRAVVGLNLLIHEDLRIMPQVELIHWLGDPSEFSPTEALTPYLMFSLDL